MSSAPPPNEELADLAAILGEDNVRTLVRTFLQEFPVLLHELSGGDRKNRHRLAHSLKSNSRLVGAIQLSRQMAAIEERLASPTGADIDAEDLSVVAREFEAIVLPLRTFIGE